MVCSGLPSQLGPLHFVNPTPEDIQDAQVFESLEGAFRNVADGIMAEAQDAQATQVGQALLIQPGEIVEGQNPEEGEGEANVIIRSQGCLLLSPPEYQVTCSQVSVGREYAHKNPEGKSGWVARNPLGPITHIV